MQRAVASSFALGAAGASAFALCAEDDDALRRKLAADRNRPHYHIVPPAHFTIRTGRCIGRARITCSTSSAVRRNVQKEILVSRRDPAEARKVIGESRTAYFERKSTAQTKPKRPRAARR